jgi:hypothetical protein
MTEREDRLATTKKNATPGLFSLAATLELTVF